MAKDGNNGRKGGQENNGRSHKRNKRSPPTRASKAILRLGPQPASKRTTFFKLQDAMDNEVKERLDNWRDGEDAPVLLDMLIKAISICNKYSLYNGDGDWKAVVQAVSRALTGKCAKHLDELIKNTNNWGQDGANKHKRIVQELCENIFKKRGYKYQKDVMRNVLPYQGNDHREATKQLFEINEILPNMCGGGSKFDAKDFHRNIIVAALHEKARTEFIKRDGRNVRDEDEVLDLQEEIQDGIEAKMQIKHANRRRNNNN